MRSTVRHIKRVEDTPTEPFDARTLAFRRAQFDERMVMIRHLVATAEGDEAEYVYRTLMEQCKFLSRRNGLGLE